MNAVRAILVDDHTVLREGLRRSLEAAGVSVVADVGTGREALQAASASRPDVVLVDVSLPDQSGVEVTRQILSMLPGTAVVVLTMFSDEATVRAAYAAGAVGYLVKDCTTAEIVSTLRSAAEGTQGTRRDMAASYLKTTSHLAPHAPGQEPLTQREVEVLRMLANGASTAEVAQSLFISSKTVKNHLAHIYSKLGVESRTQAVAKAVRLGAVRIG
jgi:DNA-binding NarL/FixJ family response regulator